MDHTFFIDTLFMDVLHSSKGKMALSLFWAVMIPSRFLVGRFSHHAKAILVTSIIAIPFTMLLLVTASSPDLVMLLCVPLGFASGAIYPSVLTILMPLAGKQTATATGIITATTGIGGVVFTAMTGSLADGFGMRAAMLVLVSFFSLSLLAALVVIKQNRQETG
ncbi:MAG: MFS transporter [Blautia sp.]|nr:MFS transporter [Blautia sp.]